MKRSDAKPRKARPAEPSFLSNAKNAFERQGTAKKWREKLSYYVYDENYAHRLVRAGERYYKYDANGNIICEQDGSFDSNDDDGTYHKIQEESDEVYSTDYGWGLFRDDGTDIKGKHIRYKRMYSWNEKNQLVFSEDASHSTSYIYGHDGQRTNKYTRSSETLYFNNMWTLHTDAGNNDYGGQYAKNVYLGETRIVTKLYLKNDPRVDAEEVQQYFYHSDHLGSASLISDYKGDEYQRIEYTPYGETWIERTDNKGVDYLPYKFTAKELDEETGLYYYGARYLDPKYSTWISTDPALGEYMAGSSAGCGGVFNPVNFNLYHYGGNNPVRYVDPNGRTTRDDYAYQLRTQGKKAQAESMEKKAASDNQGFNYNLIKEFFEIFSVGVKVGLGVNASFISEIGVDLFSQRATFSKDGYETWTTSSISGYFVSIEKTCEGDHSSTLLDPGKITTTVGPVVSASLSCDTDGADPDFDVVASLGVQIIIGADISISGKEILDFIKKINYEVSK